MVPGKRDMKRRVLLVDDDLAVLLTLKAVLELNQFEVKTATSAAEAIKQMGASEFDLVITDARMESVDAGLDVIRAARRQTYAPATALLTAYPPPRGEWSDGGESLLVKPVGTQELVQKIKTLLERHQQHPAGWNPEDRRKAG